jgi:UDP-3-O-[3-hydroxymyristoyl] glucosamine N-acyltransferase
MKLSLQEVAEIAGARLIGDGAREVGGVAHAAAATPGDVIFVEHHEQLDQALASGAGAVIAGEFAAGCRADKALLISPHPRLSFARVATRICPPAREPAGVHSTAVVHPSATLGRGVSVQERAVIRERAAIGDRTAIGPGVVVGADVTIGPDCDIKPNVVIYPGTTIGARAIIHAGAVLGSDGFGFVPDPATGAYQKFPQLGRLVVGDDVEIGANVTIDRAALDLTVIESGVKLDNLVHVAHNVRIGPNVAISAQTGIAGSSTIAGQVIIGGQVGIGDHVRIEEGTILGSQCGVPTGKILRGRGVVFWGTPARPLRQCLKELATLARLAKKRR